MKPATGRTRAAPLVTVLMAVHNGMPYLEAAVRSVMQQTLRDIEILVVDDGSTDETPTLLARLAAEDGRIRVEQLDANVGLARALNHGLTLARTPLVARMDADDVCKPHRLEVQARYMTAHPGLLLVGASIRTIDKDGHVLRTSVRPLQAYGVRWVARFHSPVMHPTFMLRARLPDGARPEYDPAFTVSEDYDLLVRLQAQGEVVNLPDVLLDYRVHDASISHRNRKLQWEQSREIATRHQHAELPLGVIDALGPFRAAFFDQKPASPAKIFAGLRRMRAHDLSQAPAERAWVRQNVARAARQAMRRSGLGHGAVLRAFLGPGRDFLPDMALRALEVKFGLRTALRKGVWSDPSSPSDGTTPRRPRLTNLHH